MNTVEKENMIKIIESELKDLSTWLIKCTVDHRDLRKILEQRDKLTSQQMLYKLKHWHDNKNFNDEEDRIKDYLDDKDLVNEGLD